MLTALADTLRTTDPGVPVVGVEGLAGIGKTTLAIQLGHKIATSFPDGQLFTDLSVSPDPLSELLRGIGVTDLPPSSSERAALWRTRTTGRRVLIVLDDAQAAEQIRPLLPGTRGPGGDDHGPPAPLRPTSRPLAETTRPGPHGIAAVAEPLDRPPNRPRPCSDRGTGRPHSGPTPGPAGGGSPSVIPPGVDDAPGTQPPGPPGARLPGDTPGVRSDREAIRVGNGPADPGPVPSVPSAFPPGNAGSPTLRSR